MTGALDAEGDHARNAGASAPLLSGLLVYWIHFPPKFVGVLAGFGAGALIEIGFET